MLSKRQNELIEDLLIVYEHWAKDCNSLKTTFVFNNIDFLISVNDYKNICDIIDYIKGVE